MYVLDLSTISTDEFEHSVLTVELIPSRRPLRDHIGAVVASLHDRDVHDLEALRRLLKDKNGYPDLAPELGVDEGYLTLLAREVNSYVTKPLPLAKLQGFTEVELDQLAETGIKSSKDLYERAASKAGREALGAETGIPEDRLVELLELCDLVRVTGIGPASAWAFRDLGIRGPRDYLATDSETIQARYADWTEEHTGRREVLGISDIDYCRRYAEGLSDDIER